MKTAGRAQIRIEEYKTHKTQYQVICTIPVMFSYSVKASDCLEISKFLNDHPEHYIGLGIVPMQSSRHAIQELERLKSLGIKGIQIGSNINNKNLSEPEFHPLWKACEELGMAVMIYPWEMMGESI